MKIHHFRVVTNRENSCREQNHILKPGCKHVYFYYKVANFYIGVYRDCLTFGASLKWPFEELFGILTLASFFSPMLTT